MRWWKSFSIMIVGAMTGTLIQTFGVEITAVARWPGYTRGYPLAIVAESNYLYVAAASAGMIVVDIRDPSKPKVVAQKRFESAKDVCKAGNHLFVAAGQAGLKVFDVGIPEEPREIDAYLGYPIEQADKVAMNGNRLYVCGGWFLFEYDASNPAKPMLFDKVFSGEVRSLAVQSNLIYIASGKGGLKIFERFGGLRFAGNYKSRANVFHVLLDEDKAYLGLQDNRVEIISLAEPKSPSLLEELPVSGQAKGLALKNSRLYVPFLGGLDVINVENPINPLITSTETLSGSHIIVHGDMAFLIGYYSGLEIFDISQPEEFIKLGEVAIHASAEKMLLQGNRGYLIDSGNGLCVLDIANPANPTLLGTYPQRDRVRAMALYRNFVYLGLTEGVEIINISEPSNPAYSGYYKTDGGVGGIEILGDFGYLTISDEAIEVIDLSYPASPARAGFYKSTNFHFGEFGMAAADDYLYVGTETGFQIFDVSEPQILAPMGHYSSDGNMRKISLIGKYIYYSNGDHMGMVNPSNPFKPVREKNYYRLGGRLQSSDVIYRVAGWGNFAWAAISSADFGRTVRVLDTATIPITVVTNLSSPASMVDCVFKDEYVFVLSGSEGVYVLKAESLPLHRNIQNWKSRDALRLAWDAHTNLVLESSDGVAGGAWEPVTSEGSKKQGLMMQKV